MSDYPKFWKPMLRCLGEKIRVYYSSEIYLVMKNVKNEDIKNVLG